MVLTSNVVIQYNVHVMSIAYGDLYYSIMLILFNFFHEQLWCAIIVICVFCVTPKNGGYRINIHISEINIKNWSNDTGLYFRF